MIWQDASQLNDHGVASVGLDKDTYTFAAIYRWRLPFLATYGRRSAVLECFARPWMVHVMSIVHVHVPCCMRERDMQFIHLQEPEINKIWWRVSMYLLETVNFTRERSEHSYVVFHDFFCALLADDDQSSRPAI
jgi:hypothetical protein